MSVTVIANPKRRGLRLRQRYKAFAVEGQGLFLISDREYQFLEGQIFVDLFPFLSDGLEEELVADALEGTYPRTFIHYALQLLLRRNLVAESLRCVSASEEAFWDELDLDSQSVREKFAATTIGVTAIGAVSVRPIVSSLSDLGVRAKIVDEPKAESLHIVVTDDYLSQLVAELAAKNWRDNRPWLLCRGAGSELWIGPLFRSGFGCFECLSWRLRTNWAWEAYLGRQLNTNRGITKSIAQTKLHRGLVAGFVALEAAKYAAGYPVKAPHIRTMDLRTLETSEHPLHRRPQCHLCGDPELQTEIFTQPVCLTEDKQGAELTVADLIPFVSRITGIVTSLERVETGVESLHTYTGFFGFGKGATNLQAFKNSLLSQAAGVGANANQAKIGAVCEALERYSGIYHGDEPTIKASYADLDPAVTVHPNTCMLYSTRQYEMRDEINAKGEAFNLVPRPFDETAVLDWMGVWSLSEKRFKLLPSTYLFYNYPQPASGPFCWADSNGCAAGRTLADAIFRGLCEVVERDSVALWWYNRLRRPRVDLSSFRNEYFNRFVESYGNLQRDVWVLDVTSDLGIPSFVAISRRMLGRPEEILLSFGAHLDARIAIEHALSEMNHILPAVLPANRNSDGDYPYPEPSQKKWWQTATIESESYLLPDTKAPVLRAEQYAPLPMCSEAKQAARICKIMRDLGLEVMALNQTRPDVNIPVAKVIVPGLRPFWSRFAPGRLYEVPVRMGWLDRPRLEEDLNPISMFL